MDDVICSLKKGKNIYFVLPRDYSPSDLGRKAIAAGSNPVMIPVDKIEFILPEIFDAEIVESGKKLYELFDLEKWVIFFYTLKGHGKSYRNRFYYALHGRRGERGMLEEAKGIRIGQNVLMVPEESSELMRDFLRRWNLTFFRVEVYMNKKLEGLLRTITKERVLT